MSSIEDKRRLSTNELESPPTEVAVALPERSIYVKCPACKRIIEQEALSSALDVCPRCGHHLRVFGRARMRITVDEGSFEEWDATLASTNFLDFPGYTERLEAAQECSHETEAVVCGKATIAGIACATFFMDANFMMGSMGSAVGEKISRVFERATEQGLPVVGFCLSGGARMQEGLTSLMQMAKVSLVRERFAASGHPYIAVLTDPTTGGVMASFAMEGDITLAEPEALVGFAGPRVIEQTTHKRLPQGFQSAEFLVDHGFCDMVVHRSVMRDTLAELLALHEGLEPASEAPHTLSGVDIPRKSRRRTPHLAKNTSDALKYIRSSKHPTALALIETAFDGFVEFHGDRLYGEDSAVVAGIAWKNGIAMTVIAIERGRTMKDRVARNFGMAHPEGYRKALRLMKQAERFGRPVLCLVDTAGAYCGIGAEERGQAEAIATNLLEMGSLRVPIVTVITGEGGSGGALALSVADRVFMLESSAYSVVSPEACASILWKDAKKAQEAAEALHMRPDDLVDLGIVDDIIDDAGRTPQEIGSEMLTRVLATFDQLASRSVDELLEARYTKFRAIGSNRICSR